MRATEIAHALAPRAEEFCRWLYPNGRRVARDWCVGSLSGEAGDSLKICVEGSKAGVWADFGGGQGDKGDLIGLLQRVRSTDLETACAEAKAWLGIASDQPTPAARPIPTKAPSPSWLRLQDNLKPGTIQELNALAQLRHLPSTAGLELATRAGQLFFAPVFDDGYEWPAWIITDSSRRNAQARRVDGQPWSGISAKAKTIAGCEANWPVGIAESNAHAIALVEGGPDFLAAWHFIWALGKASSITPVAMFGAAQAIHRDAMPEFRGKQVWIFPHSDAAGGKAAQSWRADLESAGATVSIQDLGGCKDLNNLVEAHPEEPPANLFGMPLGEVEFDDGSTPAAPKSKLQPARETELRQILKTRAFNIARKLEKPRVIYSIAGTTVCTPGNLTTIYSQAKTGKSALIGAMLAATLTNPTSGHDTLGVTGPNYDHLAVLHFDTEQSPYDWQQLVLTSLRRTALPAPPPWLLSHSLTGLDANDCRQAIEVAVRDAHAAHGGIHSVIIDGVADIVTDPNDPAECFPLVTRLHALAIEFDTAIISVLHMNPGSEVKGRGHLGSQLERKSESNLTLTKDGEISSVTSTKQRGKSIPQSKAPSFRWDDILCMHVSCGTPEEVKTAKGGRKEIYAWSVYGGLMPKKTDNPLPLSQLATRLSVNRPITTKQLYNALERWESDGFVEAVESEQGRKYRQAV